MERPKRERKPVKTLSTATDLGLSDLEDDESDGDFSSASSDEYDPNKSKNKASVPSESSEDEEDDDGDSSEDAQDPESPVKKSQRSSKTQRKSNASRRQSHIATLRREVINKFKNSSQKSNTSQKLQDILRKAEFKRKSIFDNDSADESENENKVPNFDCSGGLNLSDSSDDDDSMPTKKKSKIATQKVDDSTKNDSDSNQDANDLKTVHDNLQKMKEIAAKLSTSHKKTSKESQKEKMNVADILAMGEAVQPSKSKSKSQKKKNAAHSDDSDSDNWEDVEEDDNDSLPMTRKEGVEIVLNDFGQNDKAKQSKPVDFEAQVKRKFNRIRKEQQEHLHKAELLSWIAHGNFVNIRLNDIELMKSVLKLIPNKKCYPKDKTDIDYFKQITNYYKQEMNLRNTEMYCTRLKNRPPLMMSLALQMKFKAAICRRDYVLIFAALLRAVGIQCRVVQSIVCDPKICPKSLLLSLSKKSPEQPKASSKPKKKIKATKIPQLDGGDNDIPKRKTRSNKHQSTPTKLPSTTTKTLSPKVKIAVDSENGQVKSKMALKNKSLEMAKKATLNVVSPRKTRSMSRDQSPASSKSSDATLKMPNKPPTKGTLKVVLPKTTRSRSRSTETKNETSKPNLQKLAVKRKAETKSEEIPPKIAKLTEESKNRPSRKRESSTKDIEKKKTRVAKVSESSEDGSLKFFKLNNSKSKSANTSMSSIKSTKIDRRVLSSDDEAPVNLESASPKKSKGIDIWVEVYSEKDERWIAIDVHRGKVDCPAEIAKKATQPLVYVFAWNNDNSIKDVSARYCKDFNTRIRKMRVDREYLNSVLHLFAGIRTSRDFKEDDELNKLQMKEGLPKAISEFKNHPLYALKRHLLKFQAIYPPEPPILGYIRDEAIYPRDAVFTLHSRESWLKEARIIKLYEKPYKMVTTLKFDRAKNKVIRDVPLELFGIWQTKDYEPPVAENGMVPRNSYGNVELFKKSMLPIGCVHLQLPGLNRVCKKLGIDCAQAVTGFDSSGGWPYPVYDGFVVCKEFEEKVVDAWNRDRDEMERKEQEKIEKRVYGNWKKLIKGLLIRERLKIKYNFEQK